MSRFFYLIALLVGTTAVGQEQETLPALKDGLAPQNFQEMWAGFDPRAEPLEVETIKEWEAEGVVLRIVRLRTGVFKGKKALLAGIYGFPKGGTNLPGLLQIHGGGQFADFRAVLTNAQRGYATISIAWAGRIAAPDYTVNSDVVKLFWEGKTDDPNYKLTTDWGALDAYHAPCKHLQNSFAHVVPAEWTLDAVESPRNNAWFLCTLAARRALTFLERQPEVDPTKLGVYGHSMGGKLTVMTAAADDRIKAAAPSCGGISNRPTNNELYANTIQDGVNLEHISCPIIFLSPANDFHGHINDLPKAVQEISTPAWRVTCSPHGNHQDNAEYQITGLLWFDQHLKGIFSFPKTPTTSLELATKNQVPSFTVHPDACQPVLSVDIYYTQHGQMEGEAHDRENTISRFWRHAHAKQQGDLWSADLPLISTQKPLWVYANVLYPLEDPETGAGYYYSRYTAETFNLSSMLHIVTPDQLKAAGVMATLKPTRVIETFEDGWEKEWFTYSPKDWARRTHKVYDEQWQAPTNAKLAMEVRSDRRNKLVVGIDQYAAEVRLLGDSAWHPLELKKADFLDAAGNPIPQWTGIRELRSAPKKRSVPRAREKKSNAPSAPTGMVRIRNFATCAGRQNSRNRGTVRSIYEDVPGLTEISSCSHEAKQSDQDHLIDWQFHRVAVQWSSDDQFAESEICKRFRVYALQPDHRAEPNSP